MTTLSVLAVDDEEPALDELVYVLRSLSMVSQVRAVGSAEDALHYLQNGHFDVVLLDIAMPGLDGLELAGVVSRFVDAPAIVFVTAHEEFALAAFDVGGAGYVLKPVTEESLLTVLERLSRLRAGERMTPEAFDTIPVELGTLTKLIAGESVSWVESSGDYVRLHLRDGPQYLVRLAISTLEEEWREHGFVRVHRGYLVSMRDIREIRTVEGHTVVRVGSVDHFVDLPVSRRHAKQLRDRLVRHARRSSA